MWAKLIYEPDTLVGAEIIGIEIENIKYYFNYFYARKDYSIDRGSFWDMDYELMGNVSWEEEQLISQTLYQELEKWENDEKT